MTAWRRAGVRLAAVGIAVLVLTSCTTTQRTPNSVAVDSEWAVRASSHATQLPQRAGPYGGIPRLADDIRPPTNSWVSGPVFGSDLPAYTGVLAVTPRSDGFAVGLPRVEAKPRTVFAPARDDLIVTAPSTGVGLTELDDLVARWTLTSGAGPVGDLVAAEGWPYVSYSARSAHDVVISGGVDSERISDDLMLVTAGDQQYGVVAPAGVLRSFPVLSLATDDEMFVFAVPGDAGAAEIEQLRTHAVNLEGASVTHTTAGDVVTTTYTLRTGSAAATLFGQRDQLAASTSELSYDTLYGSVTLDSGTTFVRTASALTESASLDLSSLSDDARAALREQVRADTEATAFTGVDTYAAGKQLYRAAMLYSLANDLNLADEAKALRDALVAELDEWLDPAGCATRSDRCFVYDPVLGGIVGLAPAYGSDEFNDHHFHYGYFLTAVGVLAAREPDLVDRYRTMADLLALDIGSPVDTDEFPRLRAFDAYRGHSWASGTAPFLDGNNQESASEAVTAWNGLAVWADASGNAVLLDEARWMLSLETQAAAELWLSPDLPDGFDSPLVAINWGGKRDYGTFFDSTPSAILGIELIPMSPVTAFLPDDERARELVASALTEPFSNLPLVDYVIMLQATADPDEAATNAAQLDDSAIDSANSRSYLDAWVAVWGATKR